MRKGFSAWRIHDPPWTESYPGSLWMSYEEESNVLTAKYVTIVPPHGLGARAGRRFVRQRKTASSFAVLSKWRRMQNADRLL